MHTYNPLGSGERWIMRPCLKEKEKKIRSQEGDQVLKSLLCRNEDLRSDPQHLWESQVFQCTPVTPALVRLTLSTQ